MSMIFYQDAHDTSTKTCRYRQKVVSLQRVFNENLPIIKEGTLSGALFVVKSAVDLFVLGEDAGNLVGGETAIDLVANHGDGGETAGTDATEGVQRELTVGSALANLDVQVTLEGIQHLLGAAHVASRAEADIDGVLALGLHGEEAVEGDDAVDLGHRHVQLVGHDFLHLGGQIAELALHLVQHVDDLTAVVTKALADVFDNIYFLFRNLNVCHIFLN